MAYCTEAEVRNTIGIASTTFITSGAITQAITEADNIIDRETNYAAGGYSSAVNAADEYYDSDAADAFGNLQNKIRLLHAPLTAITSVRTYDSSRTLLNTYTGATLADTAYFWVYSDEGLLKFSASASLPDGVPKGIRVTYTYGYSSVPTAIAKLSRLIASCIAITNTLGGSYSFPSLVSLDGGSISYGQPYINLASAMTTRGGLLTQVEQQWKLVGSWRMSTVLASGGTYDW